MTERSGPFWDAVAGRAPMPKAAQTLGLEVLTVDPDAGTIELRFAAVEAWTNPTGNVLGAFVGAMLYDTIGPTLLATLEPDEFQATLQMSTTFLRPVRPGPVIGRGRILRRDGDLAAVEATLVGSDDQPMAVATATCQVIPLAAAVDAV
jgi:uncharacterized protein (TIGR00369 family)